MMEMIVLHVYELNHLDRCIELIYVSNSFTFDSHLHQLVIFTN